LLDLESADHVQQRCVGIYTFLSFISDNKNDHYNIQNTSQIWQGCTDFPQI